MTSLERVVGSVTSMWQRRDLAPDDDDLVPSVDLIFDGATSEETFKQVGEGFTRYFLVDHAALKPNERVLDVGCGIGQKARVLTRYLSDQGSYEGIDIVPHGVEWCKERYSRYSNFNFQLADICNTHYNRRGRLKATEYRFPFQDDSFDLVFLSSVFTHMLPQDTRHYLAEVQRVLKRGGRCVVTFFLLNQEAWKRIRRRLNTIKVPFEYDEGCWVLDKESPETTVAYEERAVRGLYDEHGLSITEITYGNWCGRREFVGCLQDVIIAIKE